MEFLPAHSNNYTKGRGGHVINKIILHTVVGTIGSCINTFQSPTRKASAHYIVGWDGRVVQMVSDGDTAWHAANWAVNQESIGIEHADQGAPQSVRPDILYQKSSELVAMLCRLHNIPCDKDHIKPHRVVSLKPTACPDALDTDRIIRQAQQLLNPIPQGGTTTTPSTQQGVITDSSAGDVTVRYSPWLRDDNKIGTLSAGTVVNILDTLHGDKVVDTDLWYKIDHVDGLDHVVTSRRVRLLPPPAPVPIPVTVQPSLPQTLSYDSVNKLPTTQQTEAKGLWEKLAHLFGFA